jgi:hypothetical protein
MLAIRTLKSDRYFRSAGYKTLIAKITAAQQFYGKGAHTFLWADSGVARGKITKSDIANRLIVV